MKIAIIGYSGSGKSTLAKRLGEKYNCPVLHLDKVNFLPNWIERNEESGRKIVLEFMKNKSYVIDGNYKKYYQEKRLKEADKIIFMNFPRRICFIQAFSRFLRFRNSSRDTITFGCNEKFDGEFIKWILIDGRSKKYKDNYKRICNKYKEKTIVCKNLKEVYSMFNDI